MKSENWLPALWGERKGDVDPFRAWRQEMDQMFSDWTRGLGAFSGREGLLPLSIDVSESPKELTVKADLPGVEQKDIDVTVSGNQLTIKAEKKSEAEEKKDEKGLVFHRVERSFGSFQRVMRLPFEVDPGKVKASFKDGVLTLMLPKPAEVQKQTQKIEVQRAS